MQSDGTTSSPSIIGAVVVGFIGAANGTNFYVPKPALFPLTTRVEANSSAPPSLNFEFETFHSFEADYSAFNNLATAPIALDRVDVSGVKNHGIEALLSGSYLIDPDAD